MPSYFPLRNRRYEVTPKLSAFGTDFGNGENDRKVFQFDAEFPRYRAAKLASRAQDPGRHYLKHELDYAIEAAACRFIIDRLARESSELFRKTAVANRVMLDCRLTDDHLHFDADMRLDGMRYADAFDALACQVQEDLAIWRRSDGREWLAALHLCYPNHWAPEEKIGRSFTSVHEPIAGFAQANRAPLKIVDAMIDRGPFVRFAWGVATDTQLNHHPLPPEGVDPAAWSGRLFDLSSPRLFLRIERQTLFPFRELGAALFTIRTCFRDVRTLAADELECLAAALDSMSPEARQYKGLSASFGDVRGWIADLMGDSVSAAAST
jgi:dimethylamine monooxygenase subunit A